ncbi:high affinity immunoglobulin epsilon receptor subunit beta [Oreochromis niloticus]|uniref:High affinity immunoglobulin epsilon receptor subunit beta n=1 Tax=Oreochromis niloticus TaxID=8128 RepID=I3J1W9_ORENI|nr:high affinity immunoglobulin epsilon receptor subunit beta [Oreochromis niloticus]
MSVTVSKADGVTVLTLTSDPQSPWPPLCQIFKNLCYSPVCCSVSQHLRSLNRASQTVLGTLQIMIGLLNIGFGLILYSTWTSFYLNYLGFPFWLAALFIIFGIMCILSEKYPSPCLVILTVILNLTGVAFAITGIALYGISLVIIGYWRNYDYNCYSRYNGYNGYNDYWYGRETIRPPSLEEKLLQENCLEGQAVLVMLLRSISAVMIILSVLELCVVISSAVLGIKALRNKEKGQNKSTDDPELYKPLLEEVTAQPVA